MAEYVRDSFSRTVGSGWGSSEVGGAYTLSGVSGTYTSAVSGGVGSLVQTGTLGGFAFQSLPAATAARDTMLYARLNAPVAPNGSMHWDLMVRVSGAIPNPTAYVARVLLNADLSVVLSLYRWNAGTVTKLDERSYAAGTFPLLGGINLEFEVFGSPTTVRARLWVGTSTTPAPDDSWLLVEGETAGPQVAGTYAVRVGRPAPSVSFGTTWYIGDLYITDPVRPVFAWSVYSGTNRARLDPTGTTGDPIAHDWSYGDGSAHGSSAVAHDHQYPGPGYYPVIYTITTRWGDTFRYSAGVLAAWSSWVPDPILPLISIGGVDVCDDVHNASWMRGSTYWSDGLQGGSCTLQLRGRLELAMGDPILISLNGPDGGHPLWNGYVDQVRYHVDPIDARDTTQVIGVDVAAYLGRWHTAYGTALAQHALPARLNALTPATRVRYRAKWGAVPAARWPQLKPKAYKADQLRYVTYLDLIRDACSASIVFAYVAPDGDIVHGPWDAPSGVSSSPYVDLDAALDCPSDVELDPRSIPGMINRWIVGDGSLVDRSWQGSIETYGERSYQVNAGVLVTDTDFPLTQGFLEAMKTPKRTPEAEVPIVDTDQHALWAEPLDLARWEGRLYAIMGVRHQVDYRQGWTVTLSLDRDPWSTHGAAIP
jgi:hypothetical protein